MNYLGDLSYLALKPEAVAGTAVIPTIFVPLVSESVRTIQNLKTDRRIKGLTWNSDDLLRGARTQEGEIVILADPDNIGHFFNMFLKLGSTSGDATDGYTHPFTVGDADSYTIEFNVGGFAKRVFGVQASEMRLEFSDNEMQVRAQVMGRGQFSVVTLGVALTGAGMTSIVLDDKYDRAPTSGLVVGDTIVIGTDEVVITVIDPDGVTLTIAPTSLTYSIGEEIHLKAQTVSLGTQRNPLNFGNLLLGLGADETASTSNAGAIATATKVHDFAIDLNNNVLTIPRSGSIDPVEIKTRSKEGQIEMKQLLENADQRQAFLDRDKQAITIIIGGNHINPDFSTKELLTMKFYNVKLMENANPIEVGEYILDDQKFEILYDSGDAKAMDVSLVNRVAGADY